jgi:CheY-like chemotaxis protein
MANVLVVDDDPAFLNATEQMLRTAGYNVLRAMDGREAVQVLENRHHDINLVIVDLLLPDINGFEIIGAISRRPNSIKIIATTGVYKELHLEVAGTLGAHAIIRKPPNGRPLPEVEWLGTVQRLIGSDSGEQASNAARVQGKGKEK